MHDTDALRKQTSEEAATASYDVAVIGGGVAGLSLSIQCARAGLNVILFEKETFPFHRVCGEYISLEAWDFLEELGIPLSEMNLPVIRKFLLTAPNGKKLEHMLPLGGFGISRYKLDGLLADIAKREGVRVMENTKVEDVVFSGTHFTIKTRSHTYLSNVAVAASGKRSNLDVKWKRSFVLKKNNKLNNYVGVKYHVIHDHPHDLIALHNFKDGYCGISQVEDGRSCLCYLTTANNLKRSENSIKQMEETILYKNPVLKQVFVSSRFLFDEPVTISQVSFDKKNQVEDHVLFTGDAAGMITPLCGNGMSMAMHGSKLLFNEVSRFLHSGISRQQMEDNYVTGWRKVFNTRLTTGRVIQRFFGSAVLSNILVSGLKPFPGIVNKLISSTHGQPF